MPELSVVMSTHNDGACLEAALEGILAQTFQDFELVVINDGSTDDHTCEVLDAFAARDARVRVIHKVNEGLTKALILGCAEARGVFIARHDADDVSHPERFAKQVEVLRTCPEAVLCVCGVRVLAPEGEVMEEIVPVGVPEILTQRLRGERVGIPSHGCVMFRREAYEQVGGYREVFYYAQDADLWLRMAPLGLLVGVPEVLYELCEGFSSISASRRESQKCFWQLAERACDVREQGDCDERVLAEVEALREEVLRARARGRESVTARSCSCKLFAARLLDNGNAAAARKYLCRGLREAPLSLTLWKDYLKSFLR